MANILNAPTTNDTYISNPRFPTPPTTGTAAYMFPNDLVTDSRAFYTQFQFVEYQRYSVFKAPFLRPLGGVTLPLPRKINDVQTVTWEAVEGGPVAAAIESFAQGASATETAFNVAVASGGAIGGSVLNNLFFRNTVGGNIASAIASGVPGAAAQIGQQFGYAINPFLTMLFKSGNFKEHTLQWSFTPNDEQESLKLAAIINYFKFNMLPSYAGPFLKYPNLALIQLYPNDMFTFKFKPCAVSAVSVDYSGGGMPSFFKNGAPTVVNIAVQLKEIELWTQNDYSLGIL